MSVTFYVVVANLIDEMGIVKCEGVYRLETQRCIEGLKTSLTHSKISLF